MINEKKPYVNLNLINTMTLPAFIFIFILLLGSMIFKDYGSFYDEPIERLRGLVTYKYIGEKFNINSILSSPIISSNKDLPNLDSYQDGDHGPLFDLITVGLEILFDIKEIHIAYQLRHITTFFFFWLGLIALYKIVNRRLNDYRYALLSVLILLLSPRLFGDSFFNSKDIFFLSLFLISIYFGISFILKPNFKNSCYLGVSSALATDVRLMGVMALAAVAFIVLLRLIKDFKCALKIIRFTPIVFVIFLITLIILWPWLWKDPFFQIHVAFQNMVKFPNQPPTLYLGHSLIGNGVPWHYVPVWIAITTPLSYLLLYAIGMFFLIKRFFIKNVPFFVLKGTYDDIQDLIFLGLSIGPILVVILLKSVLYDAWRHMFFVYPFFVILSTYGIYSLMKQPENFIKIKIIVIIFFLYNLLYTSAWMIKSHPYQNLYFNALVYKNKINKFDSDYWGTMLKEALTYIVSTQNKDEIKIYTSGIVNLSAGLNMLPESDRAKFIIVQSSSNADFILTNFRDDLNSLSYYPLNFELYKQFFVDNEIVFSIFKNIKL